VGTSHSGAFRDTLRPTYWGVSGMPHAKRPAFINVIFGAGVAFHLPDNMGNYILPTTITDSGRIKSISPGCRLSDCPGFFSRRIDLQGASISLLQNHATSEGIWVRIGKANSGLPSITFDELLDEGLCFGWSESMRRKGDSQSYLQRFTPRRTKGAKSKRNQERIKRLIQEGKMTSAGLEVL